MVGTGSIARGLRIALIAQCVIAGLLVLADFGQRLTWPATAPEAAPAGPVVPGDQRRRYDPAAPGPAVRRPSGPPAVALPARMPDRLEFSVTEAAGAGPVLLLAGAIAEGDPERFARFLDTLETRPGTVALHSPGGVVEAALEIGRAIRAEGLDAAVLSGLSCVSSCPYLLAGGVERRVSRGAVVGLHQHFYETPRYLPVFFAVEEIQRGQGRTMRHLLDMGVAAELMLHSLDTAPQDIYVLLEEELLETRLATELTD